MKGKLARETFTRGFNCAQAVISAYAPSLGLERELSLKMSTGLGAGGNYNGKICGAVLGAFIVMGLKYGIADESHSKEKELLRSKLDALTDHIRQKYGSIECNALLKGDVSDPVDLQRLRNNQIFRNFCTELVEDIANMLEEYIPDSTNETE